MTPEQSKKLKVGNRICFNGDPADSGKVISIGLDTSPSNGTTATKALQATVT
jgi:hypothetical protein